MATKRWVGTATAVAQISTATLTAYDAATTYTITIGGVAVSVLGQGGTTTTTATALAAALNASTHPYFAAITWTSATNVVTGTADVAGVPFIATSSVAGGTGTIGAVTTTTASSGPNDWSTAANWSASGVPGAADDVLIEDNAVPIVWGLDQNTIDLTSLTIRQSYTGKIGLRAKEFATSSDGETTNTTKAEYRDTYLKIGWTRADIGESYGPNVATGSGRIKLNCDKAGASTTTVHGTGSVSAESNLPAVRLLLSNAAHDLYVRSAPGGVGIAAENSAETSTCGKISVSDTTSSSRVSTGKGVTLTAWEQLGGANVMQAAATVTTVNVDSGGSLQIEGDFTVTTFNVTAGTVIDNHIKTGANCINTLNHDGGTVNMKGSNEARTIGTHNIKAGATFLADGGVVTVTTRNFPAGPYTLTVAA